MRTFSLAAVVVAALALPTLAAAKGPVSATISGPGGARSPAVTGTSLGTLASAGGFYAQLFAQTPDPTLRARPKGTLGPRYTAVYVVPGPNNEKSRVTQYIYPSAKPAVLTFVRPGHAFWTTERAHGGWFRATPELKRLLARLGLPARPPS